MAVSAPILVAGAGPTGLTVANLLADHGHEVILLEARSEPDNRVRAIGVTPPSLDILDRLTGGAPREGAGWADRAGLADRAGWTEFAEGAGWADRAGSSHCAGWADRAGSSHCAGIGSALTRHGVHVTRARVFGNRRLLGMLRFAGIHPRYPYILSVPQFRTEQLLRERAEASSNITIEYGFEVVSFDDTLDGGSVGVTSRTGARREGALLCMCTGKSALAGSLGRGTRKRYRVRFLIGDYEEHTDFAGEARLYFSAHGSVESFPLPGGRRRWIAQMPAHVRASTLDSRYAGQLLADALGRRAGIELPAATPLWWSLFQPERSEAARFAHDRVMLLGDAAHTMSPIGGQGMNTGIADAELAADLIALQRAGGITPKERNRTYDRLRRRAARAAANRAALSMNTGIRSGAVAGFLRDAALRCMLRVFPQRIIASHFAMLTIPAGRSPFRISPGAQRLRTTVSSSNPKYSFGDLTRENPCD